MSPIHITIDPLVIEYSAPRAKDQAPQRPVLVPESEIGRNRWWSKPIANFPVPAQMSDGVSIRTYLLERTFAREMRDNIE